MTTENQEATKQQGAAAVACTGSMARLPGRSLGEGRFNRGCVPARRFDNPGRWSGGWFGSCSWLLCEELHRTATTADNRLNDDLSLRHWDNRGQATIDRQQFCAMEGEASAMRASNRIPLNGVTTDGIPCQTGIMK